MKPQKGPLSELTQDQFSEFIIRIGFLCFRTPIAGAFARHLHPLSTVADYLDFHDWDPPVERLAKEFWKDLCVQKLDTEELCNKWYGISAHEAARQSSEDIADFRKD